MKIKDKKTKKEFAKHNLVTQFFQDITKKIFAKIVKKKDLSRDLYLGDGMKKNSGMSHESQGYNESKKCMGKCSCN